MVSRELEKECVVVFDEAHNIDNVCIEVSLLPPGHASSLRFICIDYQRCSGPSVRSLAAHCTALVSKPCCDAVQTQQDAHSGKPEAAGGSQRHAPAGLEHDSASSCGP